ncbi:hypothetical protein C5167_004255 [Papaver somniferum]|nr:hypothetical protein C5167_004255 [Papaver somniferum]
MGLLDLLISVNGETLNQASNATAAKAAKGPHQTMKQTMKELFLDVLNATNFSLEVQMQKQAVNESWKSLPFKNFW